MTLPRSNKTLAEHKTRYQAAITEVFDYEEIKYAGAKRPGESPKHVFDFPDGLRLIISKDLLDHGKLVIHASASAEEGSVLWHSIKEGRTSPEKFCNTVEKIIREFDPALKPELVGFSSGKGIPHWQCPVSS